MMWVCRAGQKSIYAQYYFESGKIYIPWDEFKKDLKKYDNRALLKDIYLQLGWPALHILPRNDNW